MKVEKHLEDVVQEIADVLIESDEETIEQIAKQTIADNVVYLGDGWFEIEYPE